MRAITLRDIPEAIAERIQHQAKVNGTSLNKTVIDLLAKAVYPPQNRRQLYQDLDHLAGIWSDVESEGVSALLEQQRVIDTDMWR